MRIQWPTAKEFSKALHGSSQPDGDGLVAGPMLPRNYTVAENSPVDTALFQEETPLAGPRTIDTHDPQSGSLAATTTPRPLFNLAPTPLQVMQEAFFEERLTDEDLKPYRTHMAWRLARYMGRLRGLLFVDTTLQEGLSPNPRNQEPWTVPTRFEGANHIRGHKMVVSQNIRLALEDAEYLAKEDQISYFDQQANERKYARGLAILPPPVPHRHYRPVRGLPGLQLDPAYDPHKDRALRAYIRLSEAIVRENWMDTGSEADPNLGRWGSKGMFDAATIRAVWPTVEEILYWEQHLVRQAMDQMVALSTVEIKRLMRDKYNLTQSEVNALVQMAKATFLEETYSDIETDKAMMVARLENYIDRARTGLDLRAESMGLKQLAIIQGLSRLEGEDGLKDVIDVIKTVSAERVQRAERPPMLLNAVSEEG